jgi:hypothetical protein
MRTWRLYCHVASITFIGLIFYPEPSAQAQSELGSIYVMGETDQPNYQACGVSFESTIAAVQSVLRQNRIPVSFDNSHGQIRAYVNFTPLSISGICALSYDIQFDIWGSAFFKTLGKSVSGEVVVCQNGGIMTGPTYDLQERLNVAYADLTRKCISEIEKTLQGN